MSDGHPTRGCRRGWPVKGRPERARAIWVRYTHVYGTGVLKTSTPIEATPSHVAKEGHAATPQHEIAVATMRIVPPKPTGG